MGLADKMNKDFASSKEFASTLADGVKEEVEPFKKDIDALKEEVERLKQEVAALKAGA